MVGPPLRCLILPVTLLATLPGCAGELPGRSRPEGAGEDPPTHAAADTTRPDVAGPVCAAGPIVAAAPPATAAPNQPATPTLAEQRKLFQGQELITSRTFGHIFNAGDPPRVVWRDLEQVRRLGADGRLRVRWFDADLKEADGPPKRPGRWGAWIEGTAPNGTPLRRSLTFYCRPPGFLFLGQPGTVLPAAASRLASPPPPKPAGTQPGSEAAQVGPIDPLVWREHQAEIERVSGELAFRALNESEAGAVLLAGLSESRPLGRPARDIDSPAVRNDDYHLALKLKVLGLADKVRPLGPPRRRAAGPAPVLRDGSEADAGMKPGTRQRIEAVCRAWADDSGVPFAILVARNGVIVSHAAFGRDPAGKPVNTDYRCPVFSITKTVTGILFGQFVDQGRIGLDDPVSTVFPGYAAVAATGGIRRVPTFRECFTHTSGLPGHGAFGGVRNPHLDNVILNGIDANEAGRKYEYSGTGFDLAAAAMALVTGKSWRRVYEDHLFGPLGFVDVKLTDAAAGGSFTARELGVLAQWMANRGSYGDFEFVSPRTFQRLLPEPVKKRWPDVTYSDEEGIGNHWMRTFRPGAARGSRRPEDLLFGPRVVGHGSFSASMFQVDLDHGLVITQVRKEGGPRHGDWVARFLQAVADGLPGGARP